MPMIDPAGWVYSRIAYVRSHRRRSASGSTRMKNSVVGLDVDEQNEGKSTKVYTLSYSLSRPAAGSCGERGTHAPFPKSILSTFEHLLTTQDWPTVSTATATAAIPILRICRFFLFFFTYVKRAINLHREGVGREGMFSPSSN